MAQTAVKKQADKAAEQASPNGAESIPAPPDEWEKLPLMRRISWVQGSMPTPAKRGHAHVETTSGGSYDYDYVTEPDMMHNVRRWCGAIGIALLPSAPMVSRDDNLCTVHMTLTLACDVLTDAGWETQERTMEWSADGTDKGDKALNKAYTTAMRYALQKTFQIETDGVDPEQENQDLIVTRDRTGSATGRRTGSRKGGRKVSEGQVRLIKGRASAAGIQEVDLDTVIEMWSKGEITKPDDVTMDGVDELLEVFGWYKDNPDRGRARIAEYRESGGAAAAPGPEPTEFDPTREGGDPDAPPAASTQDAVLCGHCGINPVAQEGDVCADCQAILSEGEEYRS